MTDWNADETATRRLPINDGYWAFALEGSGVGLWDWDLTTNRIICSGGGTDLFGYTWNAGGVHFDEWCSLIHSDDRSNVQTAMHRLVLGESPMCPTACRVRCKDGSYIWILARGKIFSRTQNGTPLRILGSYTDITERRREEEEGLKREVLLSLTLKTGPGCIKRVASDGTLLYMNPTGLRMIEMDNEDEAIGRSVFDLVVPEHRASFIEMHQTVVKGAAQTLKFEIQGFQGTKRWMETYAVPFINPVTGHTEHLAITHDITDRKRAEEALHESELRFRTLVERIGNVFWISDPTSRKLIYVSPKFEEIWGRSSKALYDRFETWLDAIHEDDRARVAQEFFVKILAGIYDEEYRVVRPDGSIRWVRDCGKPLGIGTLVAGVAVDITERKHTEALLRSSAERLCQALDASNTGLWDWNTETDKVSYSREWRSQLGYGETELPETLQAWEELLHPDDKGRAIAYVQAYLAHPEGSYQQEFRLRHKDGSYRWIEARASFVAEPDGRRVRLLGSHTDITTRKEVEAGVAATTAKLRSVTLALDAVQGVAEFALDGTILMANDNFLNLMGYGIDEVLWQPHRMFCDPVYASSQAYRDFWQKLNQGEFESGVYRRIGKGGREVWIQASYSPIFDVTGKISKIMKFAIDITSQKLAEAKLALAAEDLERKNKELALARDKALEAVKIKAEFLATMSHEIRTPMNGVIGMTGLLLDTPLNAEQREYAETVRLSGEHLLNIINEILDFSKIEAGKLKLEALHFDLHATVEDAVSLLGERAYAKGLELMSLVQAGVPTALCGDPGRLRQVLVNLIGNAIKFTERGEVVVAVNVVDDSGGMVDAVQGVPSQTLKFEVADTGVGIAEEQLEKLFQPFTQADGSNTRKYGGTGLGLAICQQLVGMMGGQMGVQSKVGEGSVFWFTLSFPLQAGEDQPAPLPHIALRERRALIVDDHLTNRRVLEQSLRKQGVICESATGGLHALKCLRAAAGHQHPFDVAILDMQMPEMDGLELAHHIKSDPQISATRLVLLTSVGQRGDAKKAQDVGIAAYLTKPIRQSLLYECLSVVLGRASEAEVATVLAAPSIITRHTLSEAQTRSKPIVLVVDDNPVNQKVAANMLEKLGYRVNVATNGREAVESIARTAYALVFMDCQMPEMDGLEAASLVREQEQHRRQTGHARPPIPIVAMTANALHEDRERCLAVGMDDFISKPVTKKTLEVVLNRWLRHDHPISGESKAA